ncbi:hypothetical protein TNCV_3247781 [Trichonephila clavipes]|nr:hypothetical protein TNCV_3247781 [Trichonephila clavipes]
MLKGQFLEDFCRLFAWKFFFQAQHQGHDQADESLPPISLCTYCQVAVLFRCRCFVVVLADFPDDSTICLESIPKPGDHFWCPLLLDWPVSRLPTDLHHKDSSRRL